METLCRITILFVVLKTELSLLARWLFSLVLLLFLSTLHVVVSPHTDEPSRFLHNTLPYLHNVTDTAEESRVWSALIRL